MFNFSRRGVVGVLLLSSPAFAQSTFVNWETPPIHPVELTPDGSKLLVANTADERIEVFNLTTGWPVRIGSIPTGINPVSVRARTNTEAWVVNHLSDSISIVDLTTFHVVATLKPGDEPADIVFAGNPQRAFVTVSQLNQVKVYDPANLSAAPITLNIQGEDPRALATDGTRVYAAIFESGNKTTILGATVVSSTINPYPNHPNPPPNSGTVFNPPLTPGLPTPPAVGLIVERMPDGTWRDDNNHNWSAAVTWNLHDDDVAIINASTLAVTYATGLMNLNMSLAVQPGTGKVTVIGTEATNLTRFEPNVSGRFTRVNMAGFDPVNPVNPSIVDLNPHLNYSGPTVPQAQRDLSIGDPRGIVWDATGAKGYVTGMGSNNLITIDATGQRLGQLALGQGPTGLALDVPRSRLYVLNRFDGSVSVIDTTSDSELSRVSFFDPTPQVIRDGRPFFYDTHRTSGLGQTACASCHIDGKMDNLAWDLGNPAGTMKTFNQSCNGGLPPPFGGACNDWHPMKGPMTTQTLVGILGTEPFHWRGDRENLAAFDPAFMTLLGDDVQLTTDEMTKFTSFIGTIKFPPNPNRTISDGLPTSIPGFPGNPQNGSTLFNNNFIDGGALRCVQCHTLPTGSLNTIISGNLLNESQGFKVPQLRNIYEKTGFSSTSQVNNRGFGFIHDGSVPTIFDFLHAPVFVFQSDTQRRDIEAFLMCFATNTHPAVGVQVTVDGSNNNNQAVIDLLNNMQTVANSGAVSIVAKSWSAGLQRGYAYIGSGNFQSDHQGEVITMTALRQSATSGNEITFTVVPAGTQMRLGIDRDLDGFLDFDEILAFSDPSDPASTPANAVAGDMNGDGHVDLADYQRVAGCITGAGAGPVVSPCIALDFDADADVDLGDIAQWTNDFAP
ncbi:MAG TPA: hypothetical protein VGM03_14735 [Phycisphaerae bacterium]